MKAQLKTVLKIGLPVLILTAAAGTAYTLHVNAPQAEKQTPAPVVPTVEVAEALQRDVTFTVETQGNVKPLREIRLVAQVSGRVDWVADEFVDGGFFKQGDLLVRIDPRDYDLAITQQEAEVARATAALSQEQANAAQARREWEKMGEGDPPPLAVREPQLVEARQRVAAAEAMLDKARLDRERTEVRAPFNGRVRGKDVDVGQFVSPGSALATIYGTDVAEVRLPIADRELAFVDLPVTFSDGSSRGPQPPVTLTASFRGRDHEWKGSIARTEGVIDDRSRMIYAVARVQDPYAPSGDRPPLAVGLFARAEVTGRTQADATVIPSASVRSDGRVLVVGADDRLEVRLVDVLRRVGDTVVVADGVEPGERVVVSKMEGAVDGLPVQPTNVAFEPEGLSPDELAAVNND